MAGDWMKVELELPDKPEIHAMAGMLQIDSDAVVGKLFRVWQWFDKHTTDGNAFGVTYSLLDRITNVTGFGEAMVFVGWLEQNDKTLCMPKFERHTSNSAKTRALTNKRVAKSRNAPSVTEALPEKRREEKSVSSTLTNLALLKDINQDVAKQYMKVRGKKTLTALALARIQAEAEKAGKTLEQALIICCEHGWVGFEAEWESVKGKDKPKEENWFQKAQREGKVL